VVVLAGNVTNNGVAMQGTTITFSNGGGTVTTDVNGNYTRTLTAGWTGTVTASRTGYAFTPGTYSFSNLTTNQASLNFAVSGVTITGTVYFPGNPFSPRPGVTVSLSTGQTTTTDVNGSYSLPIPLGWTGTLTFSGLSYTYTPTTLTYAIGITAPRTGQNSRTNF
jgi:hypothetical protein